MIEKARVPQIIALFVILFLIASSFSLTIMASPYIVSDLGGDQTIAIYSLAFFGFGTALTIPFARPLAAKIGPKNTLYFCLFIFAWANLFCALSHTYFFFNLVHFFAGMTIGPIYPMIPYFFPHLISKEKGHILMWIFMTVLVMSPVMGACWGGTIAYLYHWQAPFYWNIFLILFLLLLLRLLFRGIDIPARAATLDWIGWCFYAVGSFCLLFAATTAQEFDWYRSPLLMACVLIGTPALLYFFLRNALHKTPLISFHYLKKPLLALAMFSMTILFALYFGIVSLLSIWLTLDVQFTPNWVAVLLGAMALAALFPRFILEGALSKLDPRIWLLIAIFFLAISCFYTTIFNTEINFGRIAVSRVIAGVGLACFLPPSIQIFYNCYAPECWVEVFEVFQILRNLGSSLGAALFAITWQRRSVFYHERLNEQLQWGSNAVNAFMEKAKVLEVPGDPDAILNYYLNQQAAALGLDDVFYLMGWILVGLFVLYLLTYLFFRNHFAFSKVCYRPENS